MGIESRGERREVSKFPLHHRAGTCQRILIVCLLREKKKVTLAPKRISTNKVKWSEIMISYLEICLAHVWESVMPAAGLIQRSQEEA